MFTVDNSGHIQTLTLAQPARMNAIPRDMWGDLHETIAAFEHSRQRVLIITGSGGNFCAGADLSDSTDSAAPGSPYEAMLAVNEAVLALHSTTKPTIAAVDGVAVGAGFNLALGCDLVVATTEARFSQIFVRRGLTLDFGGTYLLPRLVGLQRAKELALTGRFVEAEEALGLGLCLELVEPESLMVRSLELAELLAEGSPLGQRHIKAGLNRSFESSLEELLEHEARTQAECLSSEDAAEGFRAFLERRPPQFGGR